MSRDPFPVKSLGFLFDPILPAVLCPSGGHCHLKGDLFKLGLTDDSTCERCLEEDESATRILCDFEAMAYLRLSHLGQFFMEPSDYYDAPLCKVLHFIRDVGLIRD
jgi:hypothetical protein